MDYGKMNFAFATGGERDAFVRRAEDMIKKYGCVTMCDLLDTMGSPSRYTDQYCVWDSIRGWMYSTDFMVERPFIITTPAPMKPAENELERDTKVLNYSANDVAMTAALYEQAMNNKPKPGENVTKDDNVNHPDHYQSEGGLETIDVIKEFTKGLNGVEAFAIGNTLKYICRFDKKNGVEDLKKAKWYIDHVIEYRESGRKNHDAMIDSIVELMKVRLDKDGYLIVGEGAAVELDIPPEMFEKAYKKLDVEVKWFEEVVLDSPRTVRVYICPIVHDPFIREAVIGTARECGCDWDGDLVFYRGKAYYVCVGTDTVVRMGHVPNRPMNYTGCSVPDTEETTA